MNTLVNFHLPEDLLHTLVLIAAVEHHRHELCDERFRERTATTLDDIATEALRSWCRLFVQTDANGFAMLIPDRPIPRLGPCNTLMELCLDDALLTDLRVLAEFYRDPTAPNSQSAVDRFLAEALACWLPVSTYTDAQGIARLKPSRPGG